MQPKQCNKCHKKKDIEHFRLDQGYRRGMCITCEGRRSFGQTDFKDMDFVNGLFVGEFKGLGMYFKNA